MATIATATLKPGLDLAIELNPTAGLFGLVYVSDDGARTWDGRSYNTEAQARAAANREWTRWRKAEAAANAVCA